MAGRSLIHHSGALWAEDGCVLGEVWGACMASMEPEVYALFCTVADSVKGSEMQVLAADIQCALLRGSVTLIRVKMV